MRQASRFATAPLGPGLAVANTGLTVAITDASTSLARAARSDVGQTSGTHGAEFAFWGESDLLAAIGAVPVAASLSAEVGAAGVGWRLATGEVRVAGVVVADSLPIPVKGEIVGVRIQIEAAHFQLYHGADQVYSGSLPAAAVWHFAVSLASEEPGGLACAVNAGQWAAASDAGRAGWRAASTAPAAVRVSDVDHLTPHNPSAFILSEAGAPWAAEDGGILVLEEVAELPNLRYEGVIDGAGISTLQAINFWPWGGGIADQSAVAQLTVNDAGLLDAAAQAEISGVPVSIRMSDDNGGGEAIARMVVDGIEILDDGRKSVRFRDAHSDLDDLLNPGVFLPNVPALAWRSQPAVIGAVASIPYLGANSDGSVGWLSDGPLAGVAAVLDRGDPMEDGTWSLDPSNQQLLLEQPPVGPVVVDASTVGPNQQPATLRQMLGEMFRRIGKSAWAGTDADAIDAATGYAGTGYYAGDAVTVRQGLAAVLPSYGAGYWQDGNGVLRISRVVDPETLAPAFEIEGSHLAEDLVVIPDEAPNLSRRMAYQPNARILNAGELVTDLVDVPVWRRQELTGPYRGVVYSARPLASRYVHADTNPPMISVFWRAQDAQAEIDRVCALYAQPRSFYIAKLSGDMDLAPHPGQVCLLTYDRYGLESGRLVLVRSVERNPVTGQVAITLWG